MPVSRERLGCASPLLLSSFLQAPLAALATASGQEIPGLARVHFPTRLRQGIVGNRARPGASTKRRSRGHPPAP
jgi:hypothetical protein